MSEITDNVSSMSMGEVGARIAELTERKGALEAELKNVDSELKVHANNVKGQLAALNKLVGQPVKSGARRGRPPGSTNIVGDSISKQVLELIKSNPDGLGRADILTKFVDRDAAVHAAIRVHQQKGLILNKDHKWFYNPAAETITESSTEAPPAVETKVVEPDNDQLDVLPPGV